MHHEKIKDDFIKYWNEHYHNLVMPIQKKHELKKVAWEFWKESKHEVIYMTAEEYDKYLNETKEKMELQIKYDKHKEMAKNYAKEIVQLEYEAFIRHQGSVPMETIIERVSSQSYCAGFEEGRKNEIAKYHDAVNKNQELLRENNTLEKKLNDSNELCNQQALTITEMKLHCKAVDEVNERMKCCGNCKHREDCVYEHAWDLCDKWELIWE